MIISYSKNFVYVHLEKCGGTSIECSLEEYLSPRDIIMGSTEFGTKVQLAYTKRFGFEKIKNEYVWKHSSAHDIYEFLGRQQWKKMHSFATVRDPKEIVTSLYFYSRKLVDAYQKDFGIEDIAQWFLDEQYPKHWITTDLFLIDYMVSEIEGTGLNGFINDVLDRDGSFIQTQTSRLRSDVKLFDISEIDKHWKAILSRVGVPQNTPLLLKNKSERDEDYNITANMKEKIYEYFKEDYRYIPRQTGVSWL